MKPLFPSMNSPELLIIDLANMAYRHAHAGSDMTTTEGGPSGHIYLSAKTLYYLKQRYPFATLTFAIDAPRKKTFRAQMYPEYKAQRKNTLEYNPVSELIAFISCIKCQIAYAEEYEADDVIAALVHQQNNTRYTVVSTDKDLWALLQYSNVTILNPRNSVGPKHLMKAFGGLPPHKIPLYKAILGDSSDNLPKVPRLRKTKVVDLLMNAHTLDEIFETSPEYLSKNEAQKMRDHEEQVRMCYTLTQLKTDCNPTVTEEPGQPQVLAAMFKKYELSSLNGIFDSFL